MKTYSKLSRSALILMVTCLFFSGYAVSQASTDLQSRRAAVKRSAFVQSANVPARLIIQRIANLGNDVYVDLYIDGAPVAAIAYGSSYEGLLPPGRHLLSVLPTPQSEMAHPVGNDSGCAKRPDLQLHRGGRIFRRFDSGGAGWTSTPRFLSLAAKQDISN
jgi:hypothetical protein